MQFTFNGGYQQAGEQQPKLAPRQAIVPPVPKPAAEMAQVGPSTASQRLLTSM
jgi:hypothetical protein